MMKKHDARLDKRAMIESANEPYFRRHAAPYPAIQLNVKRRTGIVVMLRGRT